MKTINGVKMSRAEYDAIPAVRATELKLAAKSMFHFNEVQKGNRKVTRAKQNAWDKGTLAHSVCLENDISRIKIFDALKKDGTAYASPRASNAFDEMVAAHPDQIVITKAEFQALCDKRNAYWGNKEVAELMRGCQVEVVFCAQDPVTGLWLKCQTDFVKLIEKRFGDFKGCPDASEFGVSRMAAKAKWPIQIGHYSYVIELASGVKMDRFDFVGQEFTAPHYTEPHQLSDFDMDNCHLNFRELLNRLSVAIKENEWPGYKKRGSLVFPPWAYEFEEITEDDDWSAA